MTPHHRARELYHQAIPLQEVVKAVLLHLQAVQQARLPGRQAPLVRSPILLLLPPPLIFVFLPLRSSASPLLLFATSLLLPSSSLPPPPGQ